MDETQKQNEQALVFLGAWGTGEQVEPESYRITDYVPEHVGVGDKQGAFTALQVGAISAPPGYVLAYTELAGERECPACEGGRHQDIDACELCDGDGYIYWGEEWVVRVFVPAGPDVGEIACALESAYGGALTTIEASDEYEGPNLTRTWVLWWDPSDGDWGVDDRDDVKLDGDVARAEIDWHYSHGLDSVRSDASNARSDLVHDFLGRAARGSK